MYYGKGVNGIMYATPTKISIESVDFPIIWDVIMTTNFEH